MTQESLDIAALVAFSHRLCGLAGQAILPFFRSDLIIDDKGGMVGFDPVTDADRAAERAMRELILAERPDDGIVGEEYGEKASRNGISWTLDPIDGTRAFMAGLPTWVVLVAVTFEGRPIIGAIDQPWLGERYVGWPGQAQAHIRGEVREINVRPCGSLKDATLATTDPFLFAEGERVAFDQVRSIARLTRYGCDGYAYAMLAMGGLDLVIESGLKVHDIHAPIALIEGAGGSVTNWRGGSANGGGQVIAAGDARARDHALLSLKRVAA